MGRAGRPRGPSRAGVRDAISRLHGAGIRTVMITGDQKGTAMAVARELEIAGPADLCVDSGELAALVRERRWEDLRRTAVFARVSPEDKLSIVRALKAAGHVVAMTGDGINDAPALKAADIGIAIGSRAADVAREASDLVVTSGDYGTLPAAVAEGRADLREHPPLRSFPASLQPLDDRRHARGGRREPPAADEPAPGSLAEPRRAHLSRPRPGRHPGRGGPAPPPAARSPRTAADVAGHGCHRAPQLRRRGRGALALHRQRQTRRRTAQPDSRHGDARSCAARSDVCGSFRAQAVLDDDAEPDSPFWLALSGGLALQALAVFWPPLAAILPTARLSPADWLHVLGMSVLALAIVEAGKTLTPDERSP